jgi:hypothetical protein
VLGISILAALGALLFFPECDWLVVSTCSWAIACLAVAVFRERGQ